MKTDFFVSYNHKDTAWAEWIAWQLEEAGYSTVIQAWDFGAGQNFALAMQKAAAESERTIAVLSPDYLKSNFTAPEWAAAFARDPTGEKGILVPVRVRECAPEGLLPQIIYIDLVGASPAEATDRLLRKIKPGRAKPATEPPFPGGKPSPAEAPPFPGSSAPPAKRRRAALPRDPDYLFVNVPPMPMHFVGRDELLTKMVERLTSGTDAALSASGQGGVGKTTMAVAIAHDPEIHGYFSDGVLWAGLGLSPDVMSTLAAWGEALGVDVTRYAEAEQRGQAIRNKFGLRRLLLVIDDAWEKDAAMVLKCGGPNCSHLLTTRDDGIAQVFAGESGKAKVPVLDEEPAFELLRQFAPRACNADPDAARRLARTVDGLPLALELLGAYLAAPEHSAFPEVTTNVLDQLNDPRQRLDLLLRRLGTGESQKLTLRETILLSLNGLPEGAVFAFNALGAFAAKPESFDLEAAEAVSESNPLSIALLIARNLVEQNGNSLTVHQTIADVAREQMHLHAQSRHAQYYFERVSGSGGEWQKVEEVYGQMKWGLNRLRHEQVLDLVTILISYQRLRGLWRDALECIQYGVSVAQQQQDNGAATKLLENAALFHDLLGEWAKSLRLFEHALSLRERDGNRIDEARILNRIGLLHYKMGQTAGALQVLEQALTIHFEISDLAGNASTQHNIGLVYYRLGKFGKALNALGDALQIERRIGNRNAEASTLNDIAAVYHKTQEYTKAIEFYNECLAIRREIGDKAHEAETLNNLGVIHYNLGRSSEALELLQQALPIHNEIGNRFALADTLTNMGLVHNYLGDRQSALIFHEQALAIAQEIGHREGEAKSLAAIGDVYNDLGIWRNALKFYHKALAIQKKVGDQTIEIALRRTLGELYKKEKRYSRMIVQFRRIMKLQDPNRPWEITLLRNVWGHQKSKLRRWYFWRK